MIDARGVPLGVVLSAGQAHESRFFERLMDSVDIAQRRRPDAVAGDKGYSYRWIRVWCARRGIERIATRHEKLATSFLAMVKLAMIQRCLRLLDP